MSFWFTHSDIFSFLSFRLLSFTVHSLEASQFQSFATSLRLRCNLLSHRVSAYWPLSFCSISFSFTRLSFIWTIQCQFARMMCSRVRSLWRETIRTHAISILKSGVAMARCQRTHSPTASDKFCHLDYHCPHCALRSFVHILTEVLSSVIAQYTTSIHMMFAFRNLSKAKPKWSVGLANGQKRRTNIQ